jgi:transposase
MKPQPSLKKSLVKAPAERVLKDIRRQTRRHFSAEDKIRIVLDGLRGEDSIAELCRKEGIAQSLYYTWSKEFMEAGKRRLAATRPAPRPPARCRICAAKPAP